MLYAINIGLLAVASSIKLVAVAHACSSMLDTCAQVLRLLSCCVQVYKISPHILLPLIPRLTSDLRAKDISKRTAAMDLMGKLFALPDSQLHQDSPELLTEFLGRSRDQKVPDMQIQLPHVTCFSNSSRGLTAFAA